ncbi:hypothetical protein [Arenibacter amylolyticus]|uniref:hypothetical protein n=1 Tax=Arenibacter amylolyticus TaxID=1406873 RepID=UPI000A38B154|nr:hypothetical protein [Arenibacter amylolyticus]
MKKLVIILLSFGLFACNQQKDQITTLQNHIDSLEVKLANTYKPGFGDFMGSIQTHHAKLWFAAQNHNWQLADFEVHEIEEAIEGILNFQADREETKMIGMLEPALDSIEKAIEKKDIDLFNRSYKQLTISCNQCHLAVDMGYNVVKVPEFSPFSNQEFKPMDNSK